ncbi:MAG: hypothetical protein EOP53_00175 [Sphingobacteriales bacterium]|nr:MAG: hypothetical protein EOP53_00175 [Sphingobacteriales bacterium]
MSVQRNPIKPSAPLQILGYLAVIIYLGMGLYLLVKPGVLSGYSPNVQLVLAIVLLFYGGFRLYILIQRNRWIKRQQQQQNHEE